MGILERLDNFSFLSSCAIFFETGCKMIFIVVTGSLS